MSKDPKSEVNKEVDISGSLASWLTLIVKSVKLSQSVLEIETLTDGLNGIHATLPVLPPTQLPQLSIKAVPFGSPLQSRLIHTILKDVSWLNTEPVSELITVLNVKTPAPGFWNKLSIEIVWLFPLVTLL